jgi:hypothetical protein
MELRLEMTFQSEFEGKTGPPFAGVKGIVHISSGLIEIVTI